MHSFRVTKYDPLLRDLSGAYLRSEWTSRPDIGASFEGHVVTTEEYERVEQSYLKAARAFLEEAGIKALVATAIESRGLNSDAPAEGAKVAVSALEPVLTGLLRERFWCRLESDSAFVHVGWDYYMYLGVPKSCPGAEHYAHSLGLFVEPRASPYVASET